MHAVTYLSSDGAELIDRLFGQNKSFFFQRFEYMSSGSIKACAVEPVSASRNESSARRVVYI